MTRTLIALPFILITLALSLPYPPGGSTEEQENPVKTPLDAEIAKFRADIERLNENYSKSKSQKGEETLWKKIPGEFKAIEDKCMKIKHDDQAASALMEVALVYAEIAHVKKTDRIRKLIKKRDPEAARKLGIFKLTDHFLIRGVNVEEKYLDSAALLFECIHEGYEEVFGITEVSKVPGKRIRILLSVDPDKYERHRLYYHPTPMWHSECRFVMPDPKYLTAEGGCRIISGFAHELGHMVAMWGKYREREDDFHAWGPYCGFTLGDYVYDKLGHKAWPQYIPDYKRTDGIKVYKGSMGEEPGCGDHEAVSRLFYEIGERLGNKIYGKAFAWMEKTGRTRKINNVRYYWLSDLKAGLKATAKKKHSTWIEKAFADMHTPK